MDPPHEYTSTWDIIEELLFDPNEWPSSNRPARRRRTHVERNREEGHTRLFKDYFSENPTYTEAQFRRRFRMRKHVFLCIVNALANHDDYFQMKVDATGRRGISMLQKCTAAIHILANGSPADNVDEYVRIGESTTVECLERFVKGVNEVFGAEYLRKPTNNDIQHLLQMGEARSFPGMLGSIDCMHWEWKNCPVAWQGQFRRGDHAKPNIILKAVASQDLWLWHAYFGTAGSNNDINVLNQSPVFNDVLEGRAPQVQFTVNRTEYNISYYLADGIYPEWATFVKTIPMPQGEKRKLFSQHQEAARKDVERVFGVLQSRFAIILGPGRAWHIETLHYIISACIILHNMIVNDERHTYANYDLSYEASSNGITTTDISSGPSPDFQAYLQRRTDVHQRRIHRQLQADLVEHIWERFGHQNNEH